MPNRLGKGVSSLLILATICGVLAFVSAWADRQLLQTDYWTDTSSELLEQKPVRDALSTYLVDQLFTNLDVESQVREGIPEEFKGLSGPAVAGLRELADRTADKALASPRVQSLWRDANEAAHAKLIKILDGGDKTISTAGGVVTINVRLLLLDLAKRVGVGEKLIQKLPPNVGSIVVMDSGELRAAQNTVKTVRVFRVLFLLLTLAFIIAAIWLAAGRRRRAVAFTGGAFVGVGAGALLLVALAKGPLVNTFATTAATRPTVTAIFDTTTGVLRAQATSVIVSGLLILLGAWLAGQARAAVAFRRAVAPYLRDYLAASAAFVGVLFLLLVWWSPTMAFKTTTGLAINLLLAVSGFITLTVATRRQFPDAPVADFGAALERAKQTFNPARLSGVRDRVGAIGSRGRSATAELERLASLHDRGVLTDAEFDTQKQRLLGNEGG
jgi:hypothetical protein